jgi:transposase-like protein
MEAYVNGVSTRAVDDLVTALGIDSGISKSEVSRICAGLDQTVAAFRSRPLHHTTFRICSSTPPTCTSAARAPAGRSPAWLS